MYIYAHIYTYIYMYMSSYVYTVPSTVPYKSIVYCPLSDSHAVLLRPHFSVCLGRSPSLREELPPQGSRPSKLPTIHGSTTTHRIHTCRYIHIYIYIYIIASSLCLQLFHLKAALRRTSFWVSPGWGALKSCSVGGTTAGLYSDCTHTWLIRVLDLSAHSITPHSDCLRLKNLSHQSESLDTGPNHIHAGRLP